MDQSNQFVKVYNVTTKKLAIENEAFNIIFCPRIDTNSLHKF